MSVKRQTKKMQPLSSMCRCCEHIVITFVMTVAIIIIQVVALGEDSDKVSNCYAPSRTDTPLFTILSTFLPSSYLNSLQVDSITNSKLFVRTYEDVVGTTNLQQSFTELNYSSTRVDWTQHNLLYNSRLLIKTSNVNAERFLSVSQIVQDDAKRAAVQFRLYDASGLQQAIFWKNPNSTEQSFVAVDSNSIDLHAYYNTDSSVVMFVKPYMSSWRLTRYSSDLSTIIYDRVVVPNDVTATTDQHNTTTRNTMRVDQYSGDVYVYVRLYYSNRHEFETLHNLQPGIIQFTKNANESSAVHLFMRFKYSDGSLDFVKQVLNETFTVSDFDLVYNKTNEQSGEIIAISFVGSVGRFVNRSYLAKLSLPIDPAATSSQVNLFDPFFDYAHSEQIIHCFSNIQSLSIIHHATVHATSNRVVYSPIAVLAGGYKQIVDQNWIGFVSLIHALTGDIVDIEQFTDSVDVFGYSTRVIQDMNSSGNASIIAAIQYSQPNSNLTDTRLITLGVRCSSRPTFQLNGLEILAIAVSVCTFTIFSGVGMASILGWLITRRKRGYLAIA